MAVNFFDGTDIMRIIQNIQLLSATTIYLRVMNKDEVKVKAVKLNTSQMKDHFMNADGIQLSDIGGDYSPVTVQTKNKKSASSVDLFDTGEFHASFRVENVTSTGFDIVSDSVKDDGTDLKVEWGQEIEGLTQDSMDELAAFMAEFYAEEIMRLIAA